MSVSIASDVMECLGSNMMSSSLSLAAKVAYFLSVLGPHSIILASCKPAGIESVVADLRESVESRSKASRKPAANLLKIC